MTATLNTADLRTMLHPDDVTLFSLVATQMWKVAQTYALPLRSVTPHPDCDYRTSALGDCNSQGDVRLVMRGKLEGDWDAIPRKESAVWDTAAHELAHLKHFNHGIEFQKFEEEMQEALGNAKPDHTQELLKKLVKLQAQRESVAALGNTAEAEAFAAMINKLLVENELNASDIDFAAASDNDPVIEVHVNQQAYGIKGKSVRVAWQESLARLVSKAHLCTFLIRKGSNSITFVGTRSHATVAEYAYGNLVPVIVKMAKKENERFERECIAKGDRSLHHGFKAAWIDAFVTRIGERFDEVRKAAIAEQEERARRAGQSVGQAHSTALMRLNGAMKKVDAYMDDRFSKKRKYANALNGGRAEHREGRARGREAANRVALGVRGIGGGAGKKLLG